MKIKKPRLKKFKLKRKHVKRIKKAVPDAVIEKAAELNPLAPPVPALPNLEKVPQITNETIAEHREDVLSGARKYIYPLAHSKHRVVVITTTLVGATIIALLLYCLLALYKFYQYNTFLYRLTQVVPFPIARTEGGFVDYENYLFELRHRVHYFETQQQSNFNDPANHQQLLNFRKDSLNKVLDQAYVKKLAAANGVSVSDREVDARITEVRDQNRLGSNNKVFADVLNSYWGWSISDFKRSLKDEILAEKVVAKLDKDDTRRAEGILTQLKGGADFATLAKQVSDDQATKANGGDYGGGITKANPNIPPQVIDALFRLKPGETSNVINTGTTLEIVKLTQSDGTTATALHISINLKDISTYLTPVKAQHPSKTYVKF